MARVTLGDRLEVLASSPHLPAGKRAFAADLLAYYQKRRSLTAGRRQWVDRLEGMAEEMKARKPDEVPAIVAEIEDVLTRVTEDTWAHNFLSSVRDQAACSTLSPRQIEIYEKIKRENSPEEAEKEIVWRRDYNEKWQHTAKILCHYYAHQPARYYSNIVEDVEAGRTPNRRTFLKMVNNKYAKKVMSESEKAPKFNSGTHIVPNAACAPRSILPVDGGQFYFDQFEQFRKHGGFIMDTSEFIVSAARGAKRYKVLSIGSTVPFWIEERYVKLFRRPKAK